MVQDDKAILARLVKHEVEFVVIGGVCGVMHGAGLVTLDLDICCRFGAQNLRRLEAAVIDLHPWHRLTPNHLPFALTDDLCGSLKNLYLQTDLGKLDCLGEVIGVGNYDEAFTQSETFNFSVGTIRILKLDALIASKEAAGREKDLYAVRALKALAEKRNRQS